jgi:2OG-Fe(II) oxygenase superfamily
MRHVEGVATLSPASVRIGATETSLGDAANASREFSRTCALVCREALDPALVARLTAACARSTFVSDQVEGLGHRMIERPPLAGTLLTLLLHRKPLFRWLEKVTGCEPIQAVDGRVVQTFAVRGDELEWHDDMGGSIRRRLGVTIALESPLYDGGEFDLRPVGGDPLLSFKHDTAGTMLVFKVATGLEHRVRTLVSGGPRVVYTGWFTG